MQATINRNLLKYAVQRAITCPRCQQILDMRQVVLLTLTAADATGDKLIPQRDYTLCCKCWDAVRLAMHDFTASIPGGNLEVLDARDVFARKTRAKGAK